MKGGEDMKLLAYILLAVNICIFLVAILDFSTYEIGEWLVTMLFFGTSIYFLYRYVSK